MIQNFSRALIEAIVRKTIKDIRDTPQRSTRNLVEMGLHAVDGRFQSQFLRIAQAMLEDEDSAYYRLIADAAATVDTDRLVTFAMNLGYNSCTFGAREIRKLEKRNSFNIPWAISLAIRGSSFPGQAAAYRSVLEQGRSLGIYTWMLFALDGAECLPVLARHEPDGAFVIFCRPEDVTAAFLDEAETANNIMPVILHTDGVEDACQLLRTRRLLYSVYYEYGEMDVPAILGDELLNDTEDLHPVFTALLAKPDCPAPAQQRVYQYVNETRKGQRTPTILWDCINDGLFVDSIISDDPCSAGFDAFGNLHVARKMPAEQRHNLFVQPLREIFQEVFPKEARERD
ncbi:MAG: hypothetical protein ACI4MF_04240 [Candidatus Faecivicinus sp.]